MEKEIISNYKVSPGTASVIDTLKALKSAENAFFSAATALYGDEPGEKLYQDEAYTKFEELRKLTVERLLAFSIGENLSYVGNTDVI